MTQDAKTSSADFSRKKAPLKSPLQTAGCFSRLSNWWLRDLLRKGMKRPLTLDDIYQLPPEQESGYLADALEAEWRKERQRVSEEIKKKKMETTRNCEHENSNVGANPVFEKEMPSLIRAVTNVFWKKYLMLSAILLFFDTIIKIVEPLALGALIRFFNHREEHLDRYWGFLMGSVIVISSAFSGFIYHPAMHGGSLIGLQIQTACSALIFRKALGLSQFSLQKADVGHVVNLLASDVVRLQQTVPLIQFLWLSPIQFLVASVVLYFYVGPSCLVGVLLLASFVPFQVWLGRRLSKCRKKTVLKSDKRIKLMSEIVSGIKLIKLWAWEVPFGKRVEEARAQEMKYIGRSNGIRTIKQTLYNILLKLLVFLTLLVFVVVYQNVLTMETVFITICLYNKMHMSMSHVFPTAIELVAENKVSISRIQNFLLLDEKPKRTIKFTKNESKEVVSLRNATARWQVDEKEESNSSSSPFCNINLNVRERQLIFLVGQVGSGKTSLLHAILEELPLIQGQLQIWIPQRHIGYAAQDSWLFDGSIKDNILFGRAFEPSWYEEVTSSCALAQDFEFLPFGDETLVGERGIKLSGGQKARVGLARAVYSRADLLLLDDPFSSVDVTTAKHLFQNCIQGILKNKARIVVVHQTQFLKHADNILVLKDGALEVMAQENFKEMDLLKVKSTHRKQPVNLNLQAEHQLKTPNKLKSTKSPWQLAPENEKLEKSTQDLVSKSLESLDLKQNEEPANLTKISNNSLPSESEEIQVQAEGFGGSSFALYWKLFQAGSNFCLLATLGFLTVLSQVLYFGVDVWMTLWTRTEEFLASKNANLTSLGHKSGALEQLWTLIPKNREFDLWCYFVIILLLLLAAFSKTWLFFYCVQRSSLSLHQNILSRILKAPIFFFQRNSTGRILNRFSKDMSCIDNVLPTGLIKSLNESGNVIGTILLVSVINPYTLIPVSGLAVLFLIMWKIFIATSQSLKRLEGTTKSPILSHLANSIRGITTIRAFGQEENWIKKFDEYQNIHAATDFYLLAVSSWFITGLYGLSTVFVSSVIYGFLIVSDSSGSSVGLSVSTALTLGLSLTVLLRVFADAHVQMVSVERVLEYTSIQTESEFESSQDKRPPKDWPKTGEIHFDDVSLFYDEKGPAALHNLSFNISPAEKIGIVGKTGAGKSSLISLLFRLVEPTGKMFIDQVLINPTTPGFGLHDLRSKISIISQDPILFTGSIRYNLDPFGQFPDDQLWAALEKVQMRQSFASLDSQITDGGNNLSFGERQLVCIARALLRRNHILVMDESTANVDLKTDTLIQNMVTTEFAHCTILCIAHRLHSVINCDRIMVLDAGRILEFDEPLKLLRDPASAFWNFVRETGEETANELLKLAQNSKNCHKFKNL